MDSYASLLLINPHLRLAPQKKLYLSKYLMDDTDGEKKTTNMSKIKELILFRKILKDFEKI